MVFRRIQSNRPNSPFLPENKVEGKDTKSFQGKGSWKPLWDLYRDGLTQGSINLFLQCREQFRLTYWEGWSKKVPSDAIEFGSCFHDCLAHMDFDKHNPQQALKLYDKKFPLNKLSGSEREKMLALRGQVAVLLEAYRKKWAKQDDGREWVIREQTFNHPIPTEVAPCWDIPLRGRFDGVFRKKKSLWLLETKTKGRIDEEAIQLGLPFDIQTMLYMYVAEKVLGEPIAGCCYDVVKRPGLRQGVNETTKAFLERTAVDVLKRPTEYFKRWEVTLMKDDLRRFVDRQLFPIISEIVDWWESIKSNPANPWDSPKHYMNAANLTNQYGRCSTFHLITRGNPFGMVRRKICYPELVD